MEQEYVIGVANRYALFLEESSHEEDPYEIIRNAEAAAAEKAKKKTLKSVSTGESKENKGKQNLKGKTTLPSARKVQGIKETQNVKANDAVAVNKPKPQDGGLKNSRPVGGGRKPGDRPQGERPQTTGEGQLRTVKFASGEPQGERTNNRRPRDDKGPGERNGDVPRNRNFREGDRAPKGFDGENGPRGPRNDEARRGGPRRDGERPFRDRNEQRQGADGEGGKPPRRENRDRRDFQERTDYQENGEVRQERRPGPPMGRTKGVGGRGGGGGGGSGGPGRNYDSRNKRDFDRKSGSEKTGVKAVDKRDGGGAHNWGNHKDDMEGVNLNSTNASEENADWSEGKNNYNDNGTNETKDGEKINADGEPVPPAEEEPKELTLDEYRALRGKRELPQYNIRKAGEGEDLTQWKNMYEIKKKKDSDNHEEEEEFDTTECPQKGGRQRLLLDIDITFSDSRRGPRGGRGGRAPRPGGLNSAPANTRTRQRDGPRRGGPRDDYGGGRDREYRGNNQAAPKVDDEHDFPSLG